MMRGLVGGAWPPKAASITRKDFHPAGSEITFIQSCQLATNKQLSGAKYGGWSPKAEAWMYGAFSVDLGLPDTKTTRENHAAALLEKGWSTIGD